MWDEISRAIANTAYLVPWQVQRFKANEPSATVLAAGAVKAQKRDRDSDPQYEVGWITARRATLILTEEKLVCGTWEIPLKSIEQAQLTHIQSSFSKGLVMSVATTNGVHYQFGLQYDPAWENQTALAFAPGEGGSEFVRLKHSGFSTALRVILWLAILYACLVLIALPILARLLSGIR